MICKYLLPFFRSPFHFIYNFPCFTKVFWFDGVPFVYSLKVAEIKKKKKNTPLTRPASRSLPSMALSRSCMVSNLLFKVYPLWVDFFYIWCKIMVQFHFFHITSLPSFPNVVYWKDYPVLIVHSCLFCHKLIGHRRMGLGALYYVLLGLPWWLNW